MQPYEQLETDFAALIGVQHAVSVNTGTAALHLALAALDIGPGDEVIVPDLTMYACAMAVEYTGATPVFVDVGEDMMLTKKHVKNALSDKTRAIMPVHLYGRPCDMLPIMSFANDYGLHVIEDGSEAHGASYMGNPVGSIGTVGCFSFYANKIVHAEEGGICVTNDAKLAAKMRDMKNLAFGDKHDFLHTGLGFNYRMSNAQASLALSSLSQIERNLRRRREIAAIYATYFGKREIERPLGSVFWQYDFVCGKKHQEAIVKAIPGARHFFKPMREQPIFGGVVDCNSNAHHFSRHGVYLPIREDMDNEEVELICQAVQQILS